MPNIQVLPDGSSFDADRLEYYVAPSEVDKSVFVIVVVQKPFVPHAAATIVTVGVEKSEAAARQWGDKCVTAFKNGEKEPPDAKERGEWSPPNRVLPFKR